MPGTTSLPQYVSPGVRPQLVETAVETVVTLLRGGLNAQLDALYPAFNVPPVTPDGINLTHVDDNRYYVSELIDPLEPPAVFVLAEGSEHHLDQGQNYELSVHRLFVVILVEDVEITRLTRAVWRYGVAAWRVLHDRDLNNAHVFVRGYDYSAAYSRKQDTGIRNFRKDITLRAEVRLYEPI